MDKKMTTLGECKPGDIVRLEPGHVSEYAGDSAPWYSLEPHDFLILSIDQWEAPFDTRHQIACWPIQHFEGESTCGGGPALRFLDRQDWKCLRLGNISEMIPDGWGDDYDLPFGAGSKDERK